MIEEPAQDPGLAAEAILGANVARLRQAQGMPMRELYARSGVAISLISRVEHGHGTSVSTAAKLAGGLGVSLSQLLELLPENKDFETSAQEIVNHITLHEILNKAG